MTTTRGQHLIGTVLGSCVLERLLGYGGSSTVFLGQQHNPKRKVAVKVFLPRSTMDTQMRRDFYHRFLHEAEAASQLHHPNILPIYSYGEQDGLPYIVMPYMTGGTLSEYIAKNGPLSLEEAQWHLEQLASALDYAHEQGCVHCDVKPANILLDGARRIMLADFGIARLTPKVPAEQQDTVIKNSDSLMGTPDYISPEQALGQKLDGRSDIYSLGVTLFFLLAKQLPFISDTTLALALMHIHEAPPSLCMVRADVSPAIDHVVRKALAKSPDQRFQTAGAFSEAFTNAIENAQYSSPQEAIDPFGQERILPAKAIVNVKQVPSKSFRAARFLTLPRLALIAALMVFVLGTTVMSTLYFLHRFPIGASQTSLVTGVGKQTNADMLANDTDWPLSSTFFYDKQHQYYHVLNKSEQGVALAFYNEHQYSNFHLSVTMMLVHGKDDIDYYGVAFRASPDQSHYYVFEITSSLTGQYNFLRFDGKWEPAIASGFVTSLHVGPSKSNTLTVDATGNSFTFFVNNKPIGPPISDKSSAKLSTGEVGLYVEQQDVEVAFSHLYVVPPK